MTFADQRHVRPSPTLSGASAVRTNPIDTFVRLATAENYAHEREDINELSITLSGAWCDHDITLVWHPAEELIEIFLAFDGRTPGGRSDDICRLMSLINERLVAGHFDFWEKSQTLVYRNTLSLRGGANLRMEQAMDLIAMALDAAERGYPACQYVVWAGKSPEDALTSALVDLASHP